ncbi:MAG: DUF1003 domain-containing protein [candidate division WOR-3 bacterium]
MTKVLKLGDNMVDWRWFCECFVWLQSGFAKPNVGGNFINDTINKMENVRNANQIHKSRLTRAELFAIGLTDKVGTIGFFLIILLWTLFWLGWNTIGPKAMRFDPYPAFVLWLFISNMIQIFLMPLIMVGQNLQGKHAEIRAENDYQINLKAEREIRNLNNKIDELTNLLNEIKSDIKNINK